MKKLLAILLVLVLTLSTLTACGLDGQGTPDPDHGITDPDGTDQGGGDNPDTPPCVSKSAHSDANEDGICDKCSYDVVVTLDVYALNDLHGKLFDTDTQIGVDELTTYLRGADTRDEEHVFLSSGDMWQGSAESNITKGAIVTDWMSSLGFVSMTLGNHEYDWGSEYIKNNAEIADFAILAINVFDVATGKRAEYCKPSVVVERGDLKIGIIGAIGDCYSSISSDKVTDVYFKVGDELTALVKAESERLRAEEGVDLVIYSIHDGHTKNYSTTTKISNTEIDYYYGRSLSRDGYVDLVFEAHTHQRYVLVDTYGVYHLQNGGENKYGISHVELDVNFVTDGVEVRVAEIVPTSEYSGLADDPVVEELHNKYKDVIDGAFGNLGYNSAYRNDYFIEELTAKLYFEAGVERWGDKYDIVLGGGFLRARSPYCLEKGEIAYSDLMAVMPFDNQLVLCSVRGSDLKRKFFETSNSDYHIYYEQFGEQVYADLDSNATYYIVVDSYTSQYAYNNLTVVEVYDNETFARDLLAEYVKKGGLE